MIAQNSGKLAQIATSGSTYGARKFNFTLKALDALPNPTNGQRAYYYDTKIHGLALAVSGQGKKTYILYRKIAGKPERITIGPYSDLSVEQARNKAQELNGDIALGNNPASSKRAVRDEATLQVLFDTYLENHAKPFKRTWQDDDAMFKFYLHSWRLRKISAIHKVDVIKLHQHIGRTNGHYSANRVIELLRGMFNKAKEWGWAGENPAEKITAFHEEKRERFLDAEELKAFFDALKQELNVTIRDYILLSLLTGARRRNVQSMRWDEIDQDTWIIPSEKAKSKK